MYKNKRGLSAVVTTLMIILLVLVAVGIVWVVVKNIVDSGVEDINFKAKCINIDINIKNAPLTTKTETVAGADVITNGYKITLERGTDSEGDIDGIKLLFANSEGETKMALFEGAFPGALETSTDDFINPELEGTLESVKIIVFFEGSSGEEKLCTPINEYTIDPLPVTV